MRAFILAIFLFVVGSSVATADEINEKTIDYGPVIGAEAWAETPEWKVANFYYEYVNTLKRDSSDPKKFVLEGSFLYDSSVRQHPTIKNDVKVKFRIEWIEGSSTYTAEAKVFDLLTNAESETISFTSPVEFDPCDDRNGRNVVTSIAFPEVSGGFGIKLKNRSRASTSLCGFN